MLPQRGHLRMKATRLAAALSLIAFGVACDGGGPVEVLDAKSRAVLIKVGDQIEINLHTIGSGSYALVPLSSGSPVRFVGESVPPGVIDPGGPHQRFTFEGVSRGMAVIEIRHTNGIYPPVSDTVVVR